MLLGQLAGNWSDTWLRLHDEAQDMLRHMQWRLHNENGTSLTPYVMRPGEDQRPVLVSYSDAGLQGEWPHITRAGYGGFVFVQLTKEVYYFHGVWPTEYTSAGQIDINEAETLASEYAAQVADVVATKAGGGRHYLYSIGDSAVHFAYTMVRDKASSVGLRWLYRRRAAQDATRNRLTCTLHVTREFNRAADAACNGDIPAFKAEVRFLLGADVVFHEIQPESTEIGDLVAFKSQHALRR